jgi:hypothetical protein
MNTKRVLQFLVALDSESAIQRSAAKPGQAATEVVGKAVSPLRSATALQNRCGLRRFERILID